MGAYTVPLSPQIIQRQLEQVEEKQRQLEERGVAVEKALRGEAGIVQVSFVRRLVKPPPHPLWPQASFMSPYLELSFSSSRVLWGPSSLILGPLLNKGKGKHLYLELPWGLGLFFHPVRGWPSSCRTKSVHSTC